MTKINTKTTTVSKTIAGAIAICLAVLSFVLAVIPAKAFVLLGPPSAAQTPGFNFTDDMGAPQPIKEFFRWNIPYLTYSFDASFVQFFGLDGIVAVDEAINVINNFFSNSQYSGVSSIDLARDGFLSNYNSHAVNVTAQNRQIIDIKSLVLGMMVNHLGLGNPHRYAYSIAGTNLSSSGSQVNFNVVNRNFDPLTYLPTGTINNVAYSYRLIHNQNAGLPNPTLQLPTLMDMEEFTADTSGNAFSAIASITDAFFGNTALFWTDIPTLFSFGSFYNNDHAVGGQTEPRHTLTLDDVGGLKYLYRTNNFVFEHLDDSVQVVRPASLVPAAIAAQFPSTSGSVFGLFPRRSILNNTNAVAPTSSVISREAFNASPQFVFAGLRGGIDSIQFNYQPFDSLLGVFPTPTNQFWTDTFINTNGVNVLNVSTGSSYFGVPNQAFFSQRVGRTVNQPDFIFTAEDLGVSVDGVPIAWDRSPIQTNTFSAAVDNQGWVALNVGSVSTNLPSGPGIFAINPPGGALTPIVYRFSRTIDGFEVLWAGEPSVLGNTTPYSLWGYIFGPGSADFITFPNNLTFSTLENAIAPIIAVPTLSLASDDGGLSPILPASLDRTAETLTLLGNNLASVQQIEILSYTSTATNLVQTISASGLIVSDQKISIPPGVVNFVAEDSTASSRKVRVRNSVGVSEPAPQAFGITTGRPVVTGTSADGETFDRAATLTLFGYGFKATQAGTTTLGFIRVESSTGALILPSSGNATAQTATFTVISDTEAVLSTDQITGAADGANRRIRVARANTTADLSPATNPLLANITSTPTVTALGLTSSNFQRDTAIDINGTGFVTATEIEIIKDDGSAFSPAAVLELPAAGVSVNANGTIISIAANSFTDASADGNGTTFKRRFRVRNEIGAGTSNTTSTFNVNVQPTVIAIAGFSAFHPTAFDRSQATGDDIVITGTGLLGATEIQIVDDAAGSLGTASTHPRISLPVNGVTVTDTSITIDTQTITFADGANADSNSTSHFRRFQVLSARNNATSPVSQRFDVALPPTFASLGGNGTTLGIQAFERNGTLTFTGANLGYMTKIEIVDASGSPITGVTAIDQATLVSFGGTFTSTVITVTGDDFSQGHLLDSVSNSSRRVRVTNPVGSIVSLNNGSGTFSVSNLPTFSPTPAVVYSGTNSGFDGNGTYTNGFQDGSLSITASIANMRGVKTLSFLRDANATGSISVDPVAPPAGVTFSADGTRIIIAKTAVPAAWYATLNNNATVVLTTAANRNATTAVLSVQP